MAGTPTTKSEVHLKYKSGDSWVDYSLVVYPVGAVYISYSSTSPALFFGGTWVAITGRFLYANADQSVYCWRRIR